MPASDANAALDRADAARDADSSMGAAQVDAEAAGAVRDANVDAGPPDAALADPVGSDASRADASVPFQHWFHIPLRVHRDDSFLTGDVIAEVLEEVNEIWWKQAGVCFEIEVVSSTAPRTDGFDLWFHTVTLGCNAEESNGVYCGDHDVHSLDAPRLSTVDDPSWRARQNPARTAAHELGHGLKLMHYDGFPDSHDSLMSSGRQGFKLHESEIATARARALTKALATSSSAPCATVPRSAAQ